MLSVDTEKSGTLLVVHAQHPLIDGLTPGPEFTGRLEMAASMYRGLSSELEGGVELYVPGSRHRVRGANDRRSLSDAGRRLLVDEGVPSDSIHGEDWTDLYRPQGVYNAGDEVFVAAGGYTENNYGGLLAICSRTQVARLRHHYTGNDLNPNFEAIDTDGEHDIHSSRVERVLELYTRYINQTWQTGIIPEVIRRTRIPTDGRGIHSVE